MVATLKYDTELVKHDEALAPVPDSQHFVAVRDELEEPMIFTVDSKNTLRLVKTDTAGVRHNINFGDALNIFWPSGDPKDPDFDPIRSDRDLGYKKECFVSFDVKQHLEDKHIFLTVGLNWMMEASQQRRNILYGKLQNGGGVAIGSLVMFEPFDPEQVAWDPIFDSIKNKEPIGWGDYGLPKPILPKEFANPAALVQEPIGSIHMGPVGLKHEYPLVGFATENFYGDYSGNPSHVGQIKVVKTEPREDGVPLAYEKAKCFDLSPEDISRYPMRSVVDFAAGKVHGVKGFFVLYDADQTENPNQGGPPDFHSRQLVFIAIDDSWKDKGIGAKVTLLVRSDWSYIPTTLATCVAQDGDTHLIIGGEAGGVFVIMEDMIQKRTVQTDHGREQIGVPSTPVFGDLSYTNSPLAGVSGAIERLHVCQTNSQINLWIRSEQGGLAYASSPIWLEQGPLTGPTLLMTRDKIAKFSPFLSSEGHHQIITAPPAPNNSASPDKKKGLVANRDQGASQMVLIMQDHSTFRGMWKTLPLGTWSSTGYLEYQAYMTQMYFRNADGTPALHKDVAITSSGADKVLINGYNHDVGQEPLKVSTDDQGMITVIVPVDDIACHVLSVQNPAGGEAVLDKAYIVDPMARTSDKLKTMKKAADWTSATTQKGDRIMQACPYNDEQLNNVSKGINKLLEERKKLVVRKFPGAKEGERTAVGTIIAQGEFYSWDDFVAWCGDQWDKLKADAKQAWEDVKYGIKGLGEKLADGFSWLLRQGEKAVEFFIRIGKDVIKFVVDTATAAANAIAYVVNKVIDTIETVIQWIGFLLDWDDIKATHKSFVHLVNNGLETGVTYIEGLEDKVTNIFDTITNAIEDKDAATECKGVYGMVDPEKPTKDIKKSSADASNSVKGNYIVYQFKHGGVRDGAAISGDDDQVGDMMNIYTNVIEKPFQQFEKFFLDLGDEFIDMIGKLTKDIPMDKILDHLWRKLSVDLLNKLKTLVVGLLKVAEVLIDDLRKYINYKITVPILSGLYKWATDDDLTLLDAVCLLLAIPTTILSKLIMNKAPPKIDDVKYDDMLKNRIQDDSLKLQDVNKFCSYGSYGNQFLMPIAETIASFTYYEDVEHGVADMRSIAESTAANRSPAKPFTTTNDNLIRSSNGHASTLSHSLKPPKRQKHGKVLKRRHRPAHARGHHPILDNPNLPRNMQHDEPQVTAQTSAPSPLAMAAPSFKTWGPDWKFGLGMLEVLLGTPFSGGKPLMDLRWAAWGIKLGAGFLQLAMRKLDILGRNMVKKVTAVVDVFCSVVMLVLNSIVNAKELNTEFDGKNDKATKVNIAAICCGYVGQNATDVAMMDDEELSKSIATGMSYIFKYGFGIPLKGTVMVMKLGPSVSDNIKMEDVVWNYQY